MMTEQARKTKHKAMPEWAEGLYYTRGSSPKPSPTTTMSLCSSSAGAKTTAWCPSPSRLMIEGLKIIEDEEHEDSTEAPVEG
jgi:hypothetical protein